MKATGVVRRIDDLGRIVLPKEIRKCNESITESKQIFIRLYFNRSNCDCSHYVLCTGNDGMG